MPATCMICIFSKNNVVIFFTVSYYYMFLVRYFDNKKHVFGTHLDLNQLMLV